MGNSRRWINTFWKYWYLSLRELNLNSEVWVLLVCHQVFSLRLTHSKILFALEFWILLRILWSIALWILHDYLMFWKNFNSYSYFETVKSLACTCTIFNDFMRTLPLCKPKKTIEPSIKKIPVWCLNHVNIQCTLLLAGPLTLLHLYFYFGQFSQLSSFARFRYHECHFHICGCHFDFILLW